MVMNDMVLRTYFIYHVLRDRRDRLWLSSDKGVIYLSRHDLNRFVARAESRLHPKLYGETEGMRNPECNGGSQPSGCTDRPERLWFPPNQQTPVLPTTNIKTPMPPPH